MIIKEISHKVGEESAGTRNARLRAHARANERQQKAEASKLWNALQASPEIIIRGRGGQSSSGAGKAPQPPRSVRATIKYALKGDNDIEGELIYSQQLDMLEPEMIAIAMDSTAEMNQAVLNPCKHFVMSWDQGEKPTHTQMQKSVQTYLQAAGYCEHQAVAYLHQDTDKMHIHIIANHVHPVTYKAVHRDFIIEKTNYKIREKVARELEIKNGWKRVEGKLYKTDEKGELVERSDKEVILYTQAQPVKISDKSLRHERHTGEPSFERLCIETEEAKQIEKDIKKTINGKKIDWSDIHKLLEKYSIGIRQDIHKKGLVVYDVGDPEKKFVAANKLSRDLSAGNLQKIINAPFEASPQQLQLAQLAGAVLPPPLSLAFRKEFLKIKKLLQPVAKTNKAAARTRTKPIKSNGRGRGGHDQDTGR
jgi:hypothetical protein